MSHSKNTHIDHTFLGDTILATLFPIYYIAIGITSYFACSFKHGSHRPDRIIPLAITSFLQGGLLGIGYWLVFGPSELISTLRSLLK